ncbi:vWA domain-containing protein [Rubellicoccus peritrichatus]|uniref:VWA domain-containing protein n=1 Tax=Rubellicoccus peritrichatus TaxID=3080537 RepID=A0AAQ3QWZ7_9BACT|nr:VWA domain-containing protein [Puniceicoccus sp. CR14]WOO42375.1 VWA domain-containing protein [Puniceicoccus sp. CR14]
MTTFRRRFDRMWENHYPESQRTSRKETVMRYTNLKLLSLTALAVGLLGVSLAKPPAETLHVDAALDRPIVPADREETVVVQIKISPEQLQHSEERAPVNLSLVLDRSGSMSGDKIRQAIAAAETALGRLGPKDYISLVIYDDRVETLAPAQRATSDNIASIRRAVRGVRSRGNTAIYAGLNQAAAELRRNSERGYINRMILLSDGLANEGPSQVADFRALGHAFATEDIVVSTVGLGLDFNEDIMTTLAEAGQGNTYFVENAKDLPRIFAGELGDVLNVVARDIEIIVRARDGARIIKSIGREAEIHDGVARFHLPQAYGGLDKLALVEVEAPAGGAGKARDLIEVEVNYQTMGNEARRQQQVTVPIAYSERKEEIREAARVDVAQNVIDNRIAEAKQEAIVYADNGDYVNAASSMRKSAEKIQNDYAILGDAFVATPSAELNREADDVETVGLPNQKRKSYRSDSYQIFNQQSESK